MGNSTLLFSWCKVIVACLGRVIWQGKATAMMAMSRGWASGELCSAMWPVRCELDMLALVDDNPTLDGVLELDGLQGPFQPKSPYGSMALFIVMGRRRRKKKSNQKKTVLYNNLAKLPSSLHASAIAKSIGDEMLSHIYL